MLCPSTKYACLGVCLVLCWAESFNRQTVMTVKMIPSSSSKLSSWTRSKVAFAMLETLHPKSMVFLLSVSRDHVQIHRSIDNTWGPKQWIWFHLSRPHYLPTMGFASSTSWFCDFLFLVFSRAFWTTPGTVARLQPWMDPKCIHGRLQVWRLCSRDRPGNHGSFHWEIYKPSLTLPGLKC